MRKDSDANETEADELGGEVDLDDVSEDDLDGDALLDEEDLDEMLDDEDGVFGEGETDDDDDDIDVVGDDEEGDAVVATEPETVSLDTDTVSLEEEDDDLEDEDDVEASLDVILKERLVVVDDEEDEDDIPDAEDRVDGTMRVLPKQPGEFVCQSCFLVKHHGQLADETRMLCRDCV